MSERARLLLFILVGGLAALVNLVSRALIDQATSYEVAIILAFPIALTTAFLLSRALVFDARMGHWRGQYWRFLLVNLAALALVFFVSVGLARLLFPFVGFYWHADTVAHAIGVASPILFSYWAHKHFSFASSHQPTPRLQ